MSRLDLKWKIILCSVVACIIFMILPGYRSNSNDMYFETARSSRLPLHFDFDNITKTNTKEKIAVLAKVIHRAKKHVRGSKTSQYLREAVSIMDSILTDINVDSGKVYERYTMKPSHICSETFKGGNFGFPMYYKGFETQSCDYGVPVSRLVTIIKYIVVNTKDEKSTVIPLDKFLSSVYDTMKNVSTLLAVNAATFPNDMETKYPHVSIIQTNSLSEGAALNKLIKEVKTPYVLVARYMNSMTMDSRLERLVREIESLNVVAAGGSFRDLNGHWKKGCFQTVYRNYTLKYVEGYDESFHECLFCDYIEGPFLSTTSYLKRNLFHELDSESNGLFEDWFLRNFQKGEETVVCPDAMFNVDNGTEKSKANWVKFAKKWDLFKIKTPKGQTVTQGCEKRKLSSRPSQALSPCDLRKFSNGVKTIMRICEENDVICELQEGTALGAVKFGKNIPWDLDFDIRFLITNCSKCKQLESAFTKTADLKVTNFSSFCCKNRLKLGESKNFPIYYQGNYGDFTGHPVMDSDILMKAGIAPTKILFDGQWVNVPRNPGFFMRNRYGKELYRHAEHWRYSGNGVKNHRLNYTTNVFMPCKEQGSHDCLDRYNADGNLPFVELPP